MFYSSQQVESLSPKAEAFKAGSKLARESDWIELGHSDRALWGKIKGSGVQPYFTQVDHQNFASKCTCPSRQFPCKHGLALMLIYAQKSSAESALEPEWVKDWVDKRRIKELPKEQKEESPEEILKKEAAKEKMEDDRQVLVQAGVDELSLWLSDLMKRGLLDLPKIPAEQFLKLASRMVDAKASGLASWVKSLANVDYSSMDNWYEEALEIIAKLNLIIKSWNNISNLTPEWQATIKNLIGWNQAPKELLNDNNAHAVKDDWIVLGQEKEQIEDILVIRTWFYGINSNITSLDLAFSINGNSPEVKFIPGSILKAELAFFNGHYKQRSIVRAIRETRETLNQMPKFLVNLQAMKNQIQVQKANNPWINNEAYLLGNAEVIYNKHKVYIKDNENYLLELHESFGSEKLKQWILNTGNQKSDIAILLKNEKAIIMGVFMEQKYYTV